MSTRPSARAASPVQKMLSADVTELNTPVTGSHTRASLPRNWPSWNSALPLGIRFEWTVTIGKVNGPIHRPVFAGLPADAFENVTLTTGALPMFREPSHAYAPIACAPFASNAVLNVVVYGGVVIIAPTFTPSTWNCTPPTPLSLSMAVAVNVALPVSCAEPPGLVIVTVGGFTSD